MWLTWFMGSSGHGPIVDRPWRRLHTACQDHGWTQSHRNHLIKHFYKWRDCKKEVNVCFDLIFSNGRFMAYYNSLSFPTYQIYTYNERVSLSFLRLVKVFRSWLCTDMPPCQLGSDDGVSTLDPSLSQLEIRNAKWISQIRLSSKVQETLSMKECSEVHSFWV